jgi:DNA polymerase III subunit epsilon
MSLSSWWSALLGRDGGAARNHSAASQARRWVVLDVETTGLDVHHDQLLAVAAVAVHLGAQDDGNAKPRIVLQDRFEAVLQRPQALADKDNILVHGIGVGAQRAGQPAAQTLDDFSQWVADAPLVAFHAAFDRAMLNRAMASVGLNALQGPWLDLAPVAAALHPQARGRALDDWLGHFGIECAVRHQAAADTLATSELLLRLWPAARAKRCAHWHGLSALDRDQRWLT